MTARFHSRSTVNEDLEAWSVRPRTATSRDSFKDRVWVLARRGSPIILAVAACTLVAIVWIESLRTRFGVDPFRIEVVGATIGLVLGTVIARSLEYRNSVFWREDDVVRALALPVLAAVPVLTTPLERKARDRRLVPVAMVAFGLVGSIAWVTWWIWRQ
jgi:hypothetical protein